MARYAKPGELVTSFSAVDGNSSASFAYHATHEMISEEMISDEMT